MSVAIKDVGSSGVSHRNCRMDYAVILIPVPAGDPSCTEVSGRDLFKGLDGVGGLAYSAAFRSGRPIIKRLVNGMHRQIASIIQDGKKRFFRTNEKTQ